jgi:hypothetical protein
MFGLILDALPQGPLGVFLYRARQCAAVEKVPEVHFWPAISFSRYFQSGCGIDRSLTSGPSLF